MKTSAELDFYNKLSSGQTCCDELLNNLDILHGRNKTVKIDAFQMLKHPKRDIHKKKMRKGTRTPSDPTNYMRKCINCDHILHSEEHTCSKCAIVQETDWLVMPTQNEMKFKLQTHNVITCAYKRINHFNEKLSQFQGKEKTLIPNEIFEKIKDEIEKNQGLELETVTPKLMKYILKKLDLSKYYEHVNYITNKINNYTLPHLSTAEEDNLRRMFQAIQEPFARHSPPARKNFLNYAYIFRKFMELLCYDYFLENFSELKSREKLYEQDMIWMKICKDLHWQFIPSV